MGRFETKDEHPKRWHQPVRVPRNKRDVFAAARELIDDLDGWVVHSIDEQALRIQCERDNGLLKGKSRIEVRVEGPDGMPNSTTTCSSESSGAVLGRDKGNVAEFVQKFWMRLT